MLRGHEIHSKRFVTKAENANLMAFLLSKFSGGLGTMMTRNSSPEQGTSGDSRDELLLGLMYRDKLRDLRELQANVLPVPKPNNH